jgi:hypothetical protein
MRAETSGERKGRVPSPGDVQQQIVGLSFRAVTKDGPFRDFLNDFIFLYIF